MNPLLVGAGLVALLSWATSRPRPRRASPAQRTPEPSPAPALAPVKGLEHTSPTFRRRLVELAGELGMNPQHLALVMSFETAGTFDPAIRNPQSGATGLIQFLPDTAHRLGTSTAKLAALSAEEQLEWVRRYFQGFRPLTTLEDVYMAVLLPSAIGLGRDHVLFTAGSKAYEQNRGLDRDGDGRVTVGEATDRVQQMGRPEESAPALRRLLLVGDSLTLGLAPPLQVLAHKAGAQMSVRGRNGSTIDAWAGGAELGEALAAVRPTITLICLGTNDMRGVVEAERKRARIRAIVMRVLQAGSAVAWIGPPSMPFKDRGVRGLLAEELERLNVRLFNSEKRELERAVDRIHMTPQGYAEWAQQIGEWAII